MLIIKYLTTSLIVMFVAMYTLTPTLVLIADKVIPFKYGFSAWYGYYDFVVCSCSVQGYFDPNALPVTLNSNGQGVYYLSDIDNTYYVAIDSDNNIKPLLESQIANVSFT